VKLAGLWRLLAIGVALMAWLDPPVGVRTVPPVLVDVAVQQGREADARALLAEVGGTLPVHVALGPLQVFDPSGPAPCMTARPCVVLGAALDPMRLATDVLERTVLVSLPPAARAARVVQVMTSPAHQLGAAQSTVTIESRGLSGARGRVMLTANGTPAGTADVAFAADGRHDVTVPWVPPAMSPMVLDASIELAADGGPIEITGTRTLVAVRSSPWPVLLHEARPSWATTFVRRALEADPRFAVSAQTRVAPEVLLGRSGAAATGAPGGAALGEAALDAAHIAIVGAAEQLSAAEVSRLERFVRLRGGALVLVPDREWSGPIARLVPGRWLLSATAEPRRLGPFSGREWLLADQPGPGAVPVLSDGEAIGAVVTPMGHGLTMVTGALDAWRFRGDGAEWNRFWSSLLADVAGRTPDRLQVTAEPGDRDGRFVLDVRRRSMTALASLEVSAVQQCTDEAPHPVRVWPGLHLDQFRVETGTAGTPCRVTVTAGVDVASVTLPADRVASGVGSLPLESWGAAVTRAGGSHVTTGAAGLAERLAAIAPPDPVDEVRYPMRSPLWMLVFLGSLGLEWWLRRRAGGR